jgi:hypothetical protein
LRAREEYRERARVRMLSSGERENPASPVELDAAYFGTSMRVP